MNPVRASDYSGILARMGWVFQGLLSSDEPADTFARDQFPDQTLGLWQATSRQFQLCVVTTYALETTPWR
jgi:hypothetical protein